MVDGLGLAETTPGPLILVTEFVGYHQPAIATPAAWRRHCGGGHHSVDDLRSLLPVDYVGAPYIERFASMPRLSGALAAITAAVVGVILNLSLWFGLHVLFRTVNHIQSPLFDTGCPKWPRSMSAPLSLLALSCVLLFGFRWGVPATLAAASLSGLALGVLG